MSDHLVPVSSDTDPVLANQAPSLVDQVQAIPPISASTEPQILLILVGLPGSGKTTFSEALVGQSEIGAISGKGRKWVRASQDDAPNRRRQECEYVVRQALRDGHNVVVDRVDFDPVQRSHFINIALSHQPTPPKIYCLTLTASQITLEKRLEYRPNHPTIPDLETGLRVLRQMGTQFQPPRPDQAEGFDRKYELPENEQPPDGIWTEEMIDGILRKIEFEGLQEIGPIIPLQMPSNTSSMNGSRGRGGHFNARGRGDSTWSRGRGGYQGLSNGFSAGGPTKWSDGYGTRQNGESSWNQGASRPPYRGRGYSRGGYSDYNKQRPYEARCSDSGVYSQPDTWRQPYHNQSTPLPSNPNSRPPL